MGAVPASVPIVASERLSLSLDVIGVLLLPLFLAPLLWVFAGAPCAMSDHCDHSSGAEAEAEAVAGVGAGEEACLPAVAVIVGLVCPQLFGDLYIKGSPHWDLAAPPSTLHCPHPLRATQSRVPQPAGPRRASHPLALPMKHLPGPL